MVQQILSPRVKNRQETDACPEMARGRCDLQQSLAHSPEKQPVDHTWILQREWRQHIGQCEDYMRVRHGKQNLLLRCEPGRGGGTLTFRAVSVATGIIGIRFVAARVAHIYMAAEHSRAAGEKRTNDLRLCCAEPLEAALPLECTQQIGNLQGWSLHSAKERFNLQSIEWTGSRSQPLRRHVRVDFCRPDAVMPEQRLDQTQVRARFQ